MLGGGVVMAGERDAVLARVVDEVAAVRLGVLRLQRRLRCATWRSNFSSLQPFLPV